MYLRQVHGGQSQLCAWEDCVFLRVAAFEVKSGQQSPVTLPVLAVKLAPGCELNEIKHLKTKVKRCFRNYLNVAVVGKFGLRGSNGHSNLSDSATAC